MARSAARSTWVTYSPAPFSSTSPAELPEALMILPPSRAARRARSRILASVTVEAASSDRPWRPSALLSPLEVCRAGATRTIQSESPARLAVRIVTGLTPLPVSYTVSVRGPDSGPSICHGIQGDRRVGVQLAPTLRNRTQRVRFLSGPTAKDGNVLKTGLSCRRYSNWSGRGVDPRRARRRALRSEALLNAAGSVPACTRPPRRSRTRRFARWHVSV
jgi:hypothetical protein